MQNFIPNRLELLKTHHCAVDWSLRIVTAKKVKNLNSGFKYQLVVISSVVCERSHRLFGRPLTLLKKCYKDLIYLFCYVSLKIFCTAIRRQEKESTDIRICLLTRRPVLSTDQAIPSWFYFRISWILMKQRCFYFFCPLGFLQKPQTLTISKTMIYQVKSFLYVFFGESRTL